MVAVATIYGASTAPQIHQEASPQRFISQAKVGIGISKGKQSRTAFQMRVAGIIDTGLEGAWKEQDRIGALWQENLQLGNTLCNTLSRDSSLISILPGQYYREKDCL